MIFNGIKLTQDKCTLLYLLYTKLSISISFVQSHKLWLKIIMSENCIKAQNGGQTVGHYGRKNDWWKWPKRNVTQCFHPLLKIWMSNKIAYWWISELIPRFIKIFEYWKIFISFSWASEIVLSHEIRIHGLVPKPENRIRYFET